ncbi:MAG: twin-arginine translocation signal domain-containing protein [Acidobacteria bacterium]|nr:MAG: twin-arginine translocation signal domain-containing protein [Acidobacteriota bacterium]
MGKEKTHNPSGSPSSRRDFLKKSAAAAVSIPLSTGGAEAFSPDGQIQESSSRNPPNVVIIIADQFRGDFIGANGRNPMGVTPNLDAMAERGVTMQNAVTNQPLCSPSRACLFTGRYATETGMWKLPPGVELDRDLPTLASVLRSHGYTANYIGKWHLAPIDQDCRKGLGFVEPQDRGGFLDLWQASNVIELTSHPYEGTIWDGDGKPIHFKDVYRVDYLTDLAVRFLKLRHQKPFLLVLSHLEPHFQNDVNAFVPPRGYAERYQNPFAPEDLRFFPGDWQAQLPGYYGDIKRIDESVGTVLKTLAEESLEDNTIVLFISDHGCHFRTRNTEYKRSPHESSIHIPMILQGPGLNRSRKVQEVVSMVDMTPTLLEAVGIPAPASMKGRSFLPLINGTKGHANWRSEAFVQISASMVARALRTDQWTYCVVDPDGNGDRDSHSMRYQEYQMYNLRTDPHQLLNLAGRKDPPLLVHYDGGLPLPEIAARLRERLIARMVEAGEEVPQIDPARFYP